MGLDDIIRGGIAIARSLTNDIHDTVQHHAWTGQDVNGQSVFATTSRPAIVVRQLRLVRGTDGREVASNSQIYIIEPLANQGTAGRREPIDPRDEFTLSDGVRGRIVSLDGVMDAEFHRPFYSQVFLG